MRFERNYGTSESKSYWDRLDRAVDEIREKREQTQLAPSNSQHGTETKRDSRPATSDDTKQGS